MKALKPSHKEHKRYLLIKGKDLKKNIPLTIKEYIGILGFSEACPRFIENSETEAVLSINRKSLEKVRASFSLAKKNIKIAKVSGTLKGLRK